MFLVAAAKPRVIVELGTQYGDSYCAFCQAVRALALDTRCYAVDNWQGDAHSGYYGPEVLADLRVHHDPLYADFSTLMEKTFDDALHEFKDGTIDLLHIDGLHTYDAVSHDLHAWLPKMSDVGIMLLHDINIYEHDFGVWRLWNEITQLYPCFAFNHGYGLGVAAVGVDVPDAVRSLFEADHRDAATIQRYFQALGEREFVRRVKFLEEGIVGIDRRNVALEAEGASYGEHIGKVEEAVQELRGRVDAVEDELSRVRRGRAIGLPSWVRRLPGVPLRSEDEGLGSRRA